MGRLSSITLDRRGARGYTAVEVLVAMTLFAIGAAGVISMQAMAVTTNAEARRVDVANGIARGWIERLRRDATLWTLPSISNPGANNMANAKLLTAAITADNSANTWVYVDNTNGYQATSRSGNVDGLSPAFDTLGRDLAADETASFFYCVEIRADWIGPRTPRNTNEAMFAQVRVWWPRASITGSSSIPGTACDTTRRGAAAGANALDYFSFVYAATALRKNALE
jgi:prepilin-type N-terminal cleavage/methylation domain-containing protein